MATGIRHTHIAVSKPIHVLAKNINASIKTDTDDLGEFKYFDLSVIHEDESTHSIRFASHAGDAMVHVLAENINALYDIAATLYALGIKKRTDLSISRDHNGKPLRNIEDIQEKINNIYQLQRNKTPSTDRNPKRVISTSAS